jgi:uncharacterized protein (TIGR03066 family)
MRYLMIALGVLGLSTLAVSAPVPKDLVQADKVVGTWKLVKSSKAPPSGVTVNLEMETTAAGKLILRQSVNNGPVAVFEGEYSVSKNELTYSIKYPNGGGVKKETLTIKKLNDTELSLVDPDDIQEDFERIKPKKEDPKPEKNDKK